MHCDHSAPAAELVAKAEQRCLQRGTRFTPIRRRVFELISQAQGALKAYDLLDKLSDEHAAARPPTVYRALDFLIEQGLVHRIESLNAFIACACPDHRAQFQLMICEQCGHVEELHDVYLAEVLGTLAKGQGFLLQRQTIELYGRCHRCQGDAQALSNAVSN